MTSPVEPPPTTSQPDAADQPATEGVWRGHAWRPVRYIALFLLLAVSLVLTTYVLQGCSTETAVAADGGVTTTSKCVPLDVSSGPFVILLMLVVGLLWPDLAEVTVLGVSVKRIAEAAKESAKSAQEQATRIEQMVVSQDLRIQAITNNNLLVNVNLHGFLTPAREQEIVQVAQRTVSPQSEETNVADKSVDAMKIGVLDDWQRLSELLGFAQGVYRRTRNPSDAPRHRHQVDEFIEDNERSIVLASDLRNSIAHGREVDQPALAAGASLLSYLLKKAERQLQATAA